MLTVLAFNLLGDGLNDALNPHLPQTTGADAMTLLDVRALRTTFNTAIRPRHRAARRLLCTSSGARRWRSLAKAAPASPSRPTRSWACSCAARQGLRGGQAWFDGTDLLALDARAMQGHPWQPHRHDLSGADVGAQPRMRIGDQIAEAIRLHRRVTRAQAAERAVALLERGPHAIAEPRALATIRISCRAACASGHDAIALACEPDLLIADEPTTALDVTTQAQIHTLLKRLQAESSVWQCC